MGVVCEVLIVLKVSVPLQKFDQRPVHSSRHQTRRQVGGAVTSGLQTQQALGGEGAGQGWGGGGTGAGWGRRQAGQEVGKRGMCYTGGQPLA